MAWLPAVCLFAGAAVVAYPARASRRRVPIRGIAATCRRPSLDPGALIARASALCAMRPRRAAAAVGLTAAAAGWLVAGPVAAAVAGSYAALGARAATRRARHRRRAAAHSRTLDHLCALAADLRAGLPAVGGGSLTDAGELAGAGAELTRRGRTSVIGAAPAGQPVAEAAGGPADARIGDLTAAVWRLAERTGAPAADLVERIEADVRAADRSRASAAAQAAGARATALLLAALPAGGIALGYGIGVDPLRVLLHTPLGAACAAGTVALQTAGLAWADRLAGAPS